MNLSDLQNKDIINIKDGKKVGAIIDVVIDQSGNLEALIVQKSKLLASIFPGKEEFRVKWSQIKKIGEDVILVDVTV